MGLFSLKPKERHKPTVEPDFSLAIVHKTIGTTVTRLVEGDYRGFRCLLIANPSNNGNITIGKGNDEDINFPLLKTAYLELHTDLDKVKAVGTDASDVRDFIMERLPHVRP